MNSPVKSGELIPADVYQAEQQQVGMAVSLARAEIDQQITTARAYPRSIDRAVKNIMTLATLDEETAQECIFALPRGGKPIVGPSIRLAEIICSQWGNCRVGTRVVHTDKNEKYIEAEAVFHDLETNTATTSRVRRRISDKYNKLFSDDMIIMTGNAAASIAKRNAILGGVPKAVWRKAYDAAESVIKGTSETLVVTREKTMKAFAAFGVTPERVCAAIEVGGVDDIKLEHIPVLRGMYAALKNSEATVEEMFGDGKVKPAAPKAPVEIPEAEEETPAAAASKPAPATDTPADAGIARQQSQAPQTTDPPADDTSEEAIVDDIENNIDTAPNLKALTGYWASISATLAKLSTAAQEQVTDAYVAKKEAFEEEARQPKPKSSR